ncbi:hypothetical protein BT93_H0117 [Corymbia citriodora subsp. variegata]|nr:hypothetical protein BT93_H0117 [Corymbia citriodora subsp. variegata]
MHFPSSTSSSSSLFTIFFLLLVIIALFLPGPSAGVKFPFKPEGGKNNPDGQWVASTKEGAP